MIKILKAVRTMLFLTVILLSVVIGFYYLAIPDSFLYSEDSNFKLGKFSEITFSEAKSDSVKTVFSSAPGIKKVDIKLMGIIPIKTANVETIARPLLIPCGTPFGIKLLTKGVVVTDFGVVESQISPAEKAGIKTGDIIKKINGSEIISSNDVKKAVQLNKNKCVVELCRGGKNLTVTICPEAFSDGLYKLGVWTRDSCAGIGTISFYEKDTGLFGALGHSVCDVDTGVILPIFKAEASAVSISKIVKGENGRPGELSGTFIANTPIGFIEKNTDCGVFGILNASPVERRAIPMAYKQEVEVGKATILCTLDGTTPEEFDIIIEKIDYNSLNKVKNMVIKINDKNLLERTGGIVQGMSGSPILQNGRLVGAVTHVFVNSSAKGYGIFAENMYNEAMTNGLENAA